MSDDSLNGARLFNILTEVVDILATAHQQKQKWTVQQIATQDLDGTFNGGFEIHILIDPPEKVAAQHIADAD